MSLKELIDKIKKDQLLQRFVENGGTSLLNTHRYLVTFKQKYYYMYEEDISNLLSQANTIITKN